MVNQGFGGHGEFGFGEHADDSASFVAVGVTDSALPTVSDELLILARLTRADHTRPRISDARSTAVVLSRSDNMRPRISALNAIVATLDTVTDTLSSTVADTYGTLLASLNVEDTAFAQISEGAALKALLVRADSLLAKIAEARETAVTLWRNDALTVALNEIVTVLAVLTTRTDTLLPTLTDAGVPAVIVNISDALTPLATDQFVSPIVVHAAVNDIVSIIVHRWQYGQGFGAMGEFAHGEHFGDRSPERLREKIAIFARLSRSDLVSAQLTAATALVAVLERLDSLTSQIAESDARAENRLHRRIINTIHY